ncbi:YcjF family protein [Helicobacter pylori]
MRVNSVAFSFRGLKVPVEGLEELVAETEKCLSDAIKNKKRRFLSIQKANIQKRKQAMIEECKTIIHVASGTAGAAGLIPIPFSDVLAIAPIQAGMIYKMNDAFGMDLDKSVGASLIAGLLSVTAVAQVGRTLVSGILKLFPGVGTIVGGVISSTTAVVITEALGFAYLKVLEYYYNDKMGEVDLPDISVIVDLLKSYYKIFYDEQKKLTQ